MRQLQRSYPIVVCFEASHRLCEHESACVEEIFAENDVRTKNLSTSRTKTSVLRYGDTVPSLTGRDGTMQRGGPPRRPSTCATGNDCMQIKATNKLRFFLRSEC
jgi:hypothetical protein